MTRKKAVSRTETRADLLDRVLARVDPEVVAAGLLGALAASGGLTPPLTRLLQTINTEADKDYTSLFNVIGPVFVYTQTQRLVDILTGSGNEESGTTAGDAVKMRALIASGMMEGMLMMTFVKNKEALSSVVGIARSGIQAAGEALPF